MDAVWIALGVAILVLTFLDTFIAVLNYDEGGILVNRIVRWQWIILRAFTRRVSRRWRPLVLRQVTGVLLLTTILSWIGGVVLGFTFIYLGLIGIGAFQLSPGVFPDFVGALYLSLGQFATVGADNISPAGGWVNLLPVLEALMSVVLLSFIITYLSNIYGVIQFLRSLCADFFRTGPGVGSPVDALEPYFPHGTARDLDRHLNELVDDFNLYCDSLRQDHAAYHFQSGEEQFSLPFALYMTSGVVGALRWGLPTGHDATMSPSLVRLTEVFNDFRDRRYRMMKWPNPVAPEPVTADEFRVAYDAFRAHSSRSEIDPWTLRFLSLNDDMSNMVGDEQTDVDDAYRRYTRWLTFAYPAQQFVTRVGRDLDYQPIYRGVAPAPDDAAGPAEVTTDPRATPREHTRNRRTGGVIAWARRRLLFLDPGSVRLWTALRTLGAVVLAVLVATIVARLLHADPTTAGVFAALIAVFSVPMTSGWGAGLMRSTGLLALIPVSLGIAAGVFVPRDSIVAFAVLAVVAALAVWVSRFGPRWATYGQVAFVAYYFSLLLAVNPTELVGALIAAGIGVISSWISNLLPLPRRDRQIRAGIRAVAERASVLIDAAIDALSALGERRSAHVLHAENRALRNSVTSLTGLLDPDASELVLPADQVRARRLQAFDVQLAAENLLRALPDASDDTVTLDERSRLAGELVSILPRVRALAFPDRVPAGPTLPAPAPSTGELTQAWPSDSSRARAAIRELSDALDTLLSRPDIDAAAAHAADRGAAEQPAEGAGATRPKNGGATRATDRRAVQAGVATGVALYLGSFVSSTYQYWAAMPAYQALSGSDGERLLRTVQRIIGTVLGAAAAFGLGLWTGHDATVAFVVLCISVFFMSFLRPVASSWTAFWQTVLLATMYDLLARLNAEAVHVRVVETIIGALVAMVVAAIVLPTRTRTQLRVGMTALVATIAGVTHAALQRRADPRLTTDAAQTRALAEQESTMQRQLDDFLRHVAPLRRDPGSLQRSGIETQVTSLTALAYYARHLATDTRGAPAAAPSQGAPVASTKTPAFWQHLDAATRDNFDSTLAVLDDRLPARVHDPKDFTAPSGRTASDPALEDVERINQTLLAYMAAMRPGSTGAGTDSG